MASRSSGSWLATVLFSLAAVIGISGAVVHHARHGNWSWYPIAAGVILVVAAVLSWRRAVEQRAAELRQPAPGEPPAA